MNVQLPLPRQADAPVEVDQGRPINPSRMLVWCAGLLLIITLLAAFVPIGGAVLGSGQVGVQSRVKRIAHPTGGVITAIAVKNGQHVMQGQLLMRLDDRVTGADARFSNITVEQLLAQKARLEAERLGSPTLSFPPELAGSTSPSAQKAMSDEAQLFAIRRGEEAQLRAQLASRTVQYNETIRGIDAQISSLRRQSALIEPERQGVKELWDKQLVTINRMNQLERTAADLEGNVASLQARRAETRAKIAETIEQSIQLRETRRAEAGSELARINTVLNEQQMRRVAAADQQGRSDIRAPYSGIVEKLAFSAIGDVVKPAEAIMEIVPDQDLMVVEVQIGPADIDQVRKGQKARILFSAFDLGITPEIPGEVTYVATDRSQDPQTMQPFFMVRVAIDHAMLKREGLALRSGMPAEVHVETGHRSMLSYITKPLRDQFSRAFKDS